MGKASLLALLEQAGMSYELLPHERTERALAEAQALGVDPAEVAKTLVVTTPTGYIRAVLPAAERIDLGKLSQVVGAPKKALHLASEEALKRDYAEFELGATPPFGGSRTDPIVIDHQAAERKSLVVEAGTHVESLRLKTADLVRLTDARVADICAES
jgi:Cys-tRNA(Pro) deacylase